METFLGVLRDHPDRVNAAVAIAALVVSFLSIILTVVAMYLQRQHNFKSMTPIASIPVSDYEDDIDVAIENSGIGPLIVEHLSVTDGRDTKDDLISWMPDLPEGMLWDDYIGNFDGECISPGQKVVLVKLTGDSSERKFASARDRSRKVLSKLTVSVTYRDIYGRLMPPEERELSWFKRSIEEEQSDRRPTRRR